jgi:AraC-like DNA-binding protein
MNTSFSLVSYEITDFLRKSERLLSFLAIIFVLFMILIETYIPRQLTHLVKTCWYLEVPADLVQPYEEDILPDGHHEIIFHLPPHPGKRRFRDSNWIEEPAAFIASQTLTSYRLQLMPGARLYGIRFYPHTLATFLNMPVPDPANGITPLSDILPQAPFVDGIGDSPQTTFLHFERLLTRMIAGITRHSNSHDYVHAAVQEIMRHRGNISVDQLLQRTGVSAKYLDTLFKKQVGLTPKAVSNIIRFNHFVAWQNQHPEESYTAGGYETGFYDQSHLIRSFQQYTQQSPGAYFSTDAWINKVFVSI